VEIPYVDLGRNSLLLKL